MEEIATILSANELKRLPYSIVGDQAQIGVRYRSIDQLWHPNFLQIVKITDGTSVLFQDKTRNKLISLFDLSTIIQFELDGCLHPFKPNLHYQVPSGEN